MKDDQDMTGDDTPRDARRAEHDAKRDMLDADKQDAYNVQDVQIHKGLLREYARVDPYNLREQDWLDNDEQEATED